MHEEQRLRGGPSPRGGDAGPLLWGGYSPCGGSAGQWGSDASGAEWEEGTSIRCPIDTALRLPLSPPWCREEGASAVLGVSTASMRRSCSEASLRHALDTCSTPGCHISSPIAANSGSCPTSPGQGGSTSRRSPSLSSPGIVAEPCLHSRPRAPQEGQLGQGSQGETVRAVVRQFSGGGGAVRAAASPLSGARCGEDGCGRAGNAPLRGFLGTTRSSSVPRFISYNSGTRRKPKLG